MIRLRWCLIRVLETLRWEGCTAVVLLGTAIVAYFGVDSPLRERVEAVDRAYPAQRHSRLLRLQAERAQRDRPAREYAAFMHFFAVPETLPGRLNALYESARGAGLSLSQAEFLVNDRRDLPLREVRISLPISGPYPRIRQFLTTVLDRLPTAALDDITFQRKSPSDTSIDAVATFTLFLPDLSFSPAS